MKPRMLNQLTGVCAAAVMLAGGLRGLAAPEAGGKDPAWKPALQETAVIKVGQESSAKLNSFCLDRAGNVLACLQSPDANKHAIEVYSPDGKLIKTWPVQVAPQAICVEQDGSILVAGDGRIQRLDAEGKVLATAKTPAANAPPPSDDDFKALAKRYGGDASKAVVEKYKRALTSRRLDVAGLAADGADIFLTGPSALDWSYCVYRVDRNFENPKVIVEKLSGCCGQMDVQVREGKVWIAHNGPHRVQCHDRDGKQLVSFGKQDRKAADGFGGCCEPKNLRLLPGGDLLCADSGPPVAVKRFTAAGKFLGVVALPSYKRGCVRTTVDVSADGRRCYVLDGDDHAIHVFAAKN